MPLKSSCRPPCLPPAAFRVVVQALPAAARLCLSDGGCGLAGRQSAGWGACGPKPQAATKAPRVGSNAPPLAWSAVQARVQYGAQIGGQRVPGIGRGAVELGEGGVGLPVAHVAHHAGQHVLNGAAQGLQRQKLRIANAHAPGAPMLVPFRLCSVSGSARRRRWGLPRWARRVLRAQS